MESPLGNDRAKKKITKKEGLRRTVLLEWRWRKWARINFKPLLVVAIVNTAQTRCINGLRNLMSVARGPELNITRVFITPEVPGPSLRHLCNECFI